MGEERQRRPAARLGAVGANLQPPGEASTHLVKPKSEKEALEILASSARASSRRRRRLGAAVEVGGLAGADEARTAVEEALLMPLRHPEAFAMVAAATGTGLRSHAVGAASCCRLRWPMRA